MSSEAFTEFQVIEHYDAEKNKIWKVELNYRKVVKSIHGHYEYTGPWIVVPRVRAFSPEVK